MPTRPLPNDPSLEHLRKEAKRLQKAARVGDPDALARVNEFHPRAAGARWTLADAQLVTARSYGFTSWTTLKEYFAAIEPLVWSTLYQGARCRKSGVTWFPLLGSGCCWVSQTNWFQAKGSSSLSTSQ